MKITVNVGVEARFGVLRVLDSFDAAGGIEQARQIRDIGDVFELTQEDGDEIDLRYLSETECAAKGLRFGVVEWNVEKAKEKTWSKDLRTAEASLLKSALSTYRGYKRIDNWQYELVTQLDAKPTE